jgi:hypothetical protein
MVLRIKCWLLAILLVTAGMQAWMLHKVTATPADGARRNRLLSTLTTAPLESGLPASIPAAGQLDPACILRLFVTDKGVLPAVSEVVADQDFTLMVLNHGPRPCLLKLEGKSPLIGVEVPFSSEVKFSARLPEGTYRLTIADGTALARIDARPRQ